MNFRIGVDFDNTIACYDEVFPEVATRLGFAAGGNLRTKTGVKEEILSRDGGDTAWQKLQGQVYGKYMPLASGFPGFAEFLILCKLRGHAVFVVSHKSEYGHFDAKKVPLRSAATTWMRATGLLADDTLSLSESDIFFEAEREAKIDRIAALSCTHFIDDLHEVLVAPTFPETTKRILFAPGTEIATTAGIESARSWREISSRLLGAWTEAEVCEAAKLRFQDLGVTGASLRKGRGNSRIFELTSLRGRNYALKVYPDRQIDRRPRLQTEFSACSALGAAGFDVATPIASDAALDWGVYEWLPGTPIEMPDRCFVEKAAEFVEGLVQKRTFLAKAAAFPAASEACLRGGEIVSQIQSRLERLRRVKSPVLAGFLEGEFLAAFEAASTSAREQRALAFDASIGPELQILSPSDFGAHNAIKSESGRISFIDFEYFGWDDPVKLVADFYWHPGMNLTSDLRTQWIARCGEVFRDDASYAARLDAYLPLYGLRWCLILLNEFLPAGFAKRMHADSGLGRDMDSVLVLQLGKSKSLLTQIVKKQ